MAADVCREGLSSRCSGCFWMSVSDTLEADILNCSYIIARRENQKLKKLKSQCRHDKVEKKEGQTSLSAGLVLISTRSQSVWTAVSGQKLVPDNLGPTLLPEHCSSENPCRLVQRLLEHCLSTTTTDIQTIQFASNSLYSSPASLNFHFKRRA
jgi:hypothetical protein